MWLAYSVKGNSITCCITRTNEDLLSCILPKSRHGPRKMAQAL